MVGIWWYYVDFGVLDTFVIDFDEWMLYYIEIFLWLCLSTMWPFKSFRVYRWITRLEFILWGFHNEFEMYLPRLGYSVSILKFIISCYYVFNMCSKREG